MSTPTVAPPPADLAAGESRILIHRLNWKGYLRLLKFFGDDGPRLSYLNGMVELMSPVPHHEQNSQVLDRMASDLIVGLDIHAKGQGATMYKRRHLKRGFGADQCYYLTSLDLNRGKDLARLKPLPVPDLGIEVEFTSSLLDKLAIYAGMGVPGIWRQDRDGLTVLILGADGKYGAAERSRAFPFLPMDGFRRQFAAYDPDADTAFFRSYRTWVREVVAPLHQA